MIGRAQILMSPTIVADSFDFTGPFQNTETYRSEA